MTVRIGMIAMGVNMAFNLALIVPLQHAGLALATSLAAYVNAYLLFRGLRRADVFHPAPGWGALLARVGAAVVAMGMVLQWLSPDFAWWVSAARLDRAVWLIGLIVAAGVVYFSGLFVAGIRLHDLREGRGH